MLPSPCENIFKASLRVLEVALNIIIRSADGDVLVSGVTLHVIVGATSLRAAAAVLLHHRRIARINLGRSVCALIYCGSNLI